MARSKQIVIFFWEERNSLKYQKLVLQMVMLEQYILARIITAPLLVLPWIQITG